MVPAGSYRAGLLFALRIQPMTRAAVTIRSLSGRLGVGLGYLPAATFFSVTLR